MPNPAWLIQIFEMTDLDARNMTADLLTGIDQVTVEATQKGPDCFLIVQVRDEGQASMVSRMVFAADPNSILLHTSTGPSKPVDLATHVLSLDDKARRAVADELGSV